MCDLILEHKTQTQSLNCVSACLAMLLDEDVDKVTSEFHKDYLEGDLEIHQYLDKREIPYTRLLADERDLKPNKVYFIVCPSVNIEAGLHQLIAQTDSDCNWWLLDPNLERTDRKLIVPWEPKEKREIQVNGWIPIYEFEIEDILEWRKQNDASRTSS